MFPAPGVYDDTVLDIANGYYPSRGVSVGLMLRPVSTNSKPVPADLAATAFDDPAMIARFNALLDNVFAHTPEGTAISLGCEATTGLARLWVSDAGWGFEATAIERGRSGIGSTGLGLDIARQTAQKGGGTLNVGRSRLGGAEVSLRLPLLTG